MNTTKYAMRLYAVTDSAWLHGRRLPDLVEEAILGGATFVQLREKELGFKDFLALAREVKKVTDRYHIPFVINDNVEVALAVGADGVHVGQEDMAAAKARQLLGPDKIVGVSCKTPEQARKAQADGADYIGTGAAFATTTKKNTRSLSKEEIRAVADAVSIPVVAIGGINEGNLLELKGCGVDGVAVVSAIFAKEDPCGAAQRLRALSDRMCSDD